MIFTDRIITVRKGESKINEPIIVYRGDYELEVRFTIMNSKFKFMSGTNLIESENAAYGQLAILTPYGGNIFSDVAKCNEGTVTFVLTKAMLDQIEEVGLYSFQIRLFDYNKESRVSIPPVEFGIEVREPITSEDHDNSVNNAIVGYSIAKIADALNEKVPDTFNSNGDYNKTIWETGDRISQGKLNKIEDALDKINQNEKANVAALDKRITNNFNVLNSNKADKNEVNSKIWHMSNMGQDVKEAMTGGSVAIVGENAVLEDNIVDGQVTPPKTSFMRPENKNLIILEDGTYNGNGVTISIRNNQITINGTTKAQTWLKITNTQQLRTSASGGWGEWLSETTDEFIVGKTYSAAIYEVSGTASKEVNAGVIISARDHDRVSVFGSAGKPTVVLPREVAYIQFFLEENTTYTNYTVVPVVLEGTFIPDTYDELFVYRINDDILLPTLDKDNIAKNTLLSTNNNEQINTILRTRTKILDALHDKGVKIDVIDVDNIIKPPENKTTLVGGGLVIDIAEDGLITVNGKANEFVYIKLSNGYDISVGVSGSTNQSKWASESVMDALTVGHKYFTWPYKVGGNVIPYTTSDGYTYDFNRIVISARSSSYVSTTSGSQHGLVEMSENASYIQVYFPNYVTYDNLQLYCGLYENVEPDTFVRHHDEIIQVEMPKQTSSVGDYPTSATAVHKIDIPGRYFNAIQGVCVYDHYLYCGVVNNKDDTANTTLHRIDLDTWEILESKTEFSVGHCNGMAYCDYDGYIHCIGLESFEDYKRVHRITTDLEYVDSYIIDISPYYPESTGVGSIVYNPHTEEFLFQVRGNKKGYARYTKNLTFIDILWTENMSKANSVYGGFDCDRNFIYQAIWDGSNDNRLCIFDFDGNTLLNVNIPGMTGEVEGIALYKNKLIAAGNKLTYDNHNLFEVTLSNFKIHR